MQTSRIRRLECNSASGEKHLEAGASRSDTRPLSMARHRAPLLTSQKASGLWISRLLVQRHLPSFCSDQGEILTGASRRGGFQNARKAIPPSNRRAITITSPTVTFPIRPLQLAHPRRIGRCRFISRVAQYASTLSADGEKER